MEEISHLVQSWLSLGIPNSGLLHIWGRCVKIHQLFLIIDLLALLRFPFSLPEMSPPQYVDMMTKVTCSHAWDRTEQGSELEFLHDVTASVTCQACHPGCGSLSTSQQQQPCRPTYVCARCSLRQVIQLICMTRRSGGQMIKSLFVEADCVDALGCCPTPFQ